MLVLVVRDLIPALEGLLQKLKNSNEKTKLPKQNQIQMMLPMRALFQRKIKPITRSFCIHYLIWSDLQAHDRHFTHYLVSIDLEIVAAFVLVPPRFFY